MFNRGVSFFYSDKLWRLVPKQIDELDSSLQKTLSQSFRPESGPWYWLRFMTDTSPGIVVLVASLFVLWLIAGHEPRKESKQRRFKIGLYHLGLFGVFIGASDLFVNQGLKVAIGRLKPYVNAVVPGLNQALSFPSSHAFNSAVWATLVVLLHKHYCTLGHRQRWVPILAMFICFVFGSSRIFLGEHYPLDVLGGWCFGTLFGRMAFPLFLRLSQKGIVLCGTSSTDRLATY